jgi:kumamolisin
MQKQELIALRETPTVGRSDPQQQVTVTIKLRPANPLPDPESGIRLTAGQLGAVYGANQADLERVRSWAATNNLTVVREVPWQCTVEVTGVLGDLERALGVEVHTMPTATGGSFRVCHDEGKAPDDLKDIVIGVFGLDTRPIARPHFRLATQHRVAMAGGSFSPAQLCQVYRMPNLSGDTHDQSIAIIELGGGYRQSDFQNAFRSWALPMPEIRDVSVDGGRNQPGGSADSEVVLDGQIAAAIYSVITKRPAKIIYFFAPNTDRGFIDAVDQAIHSGATTVSISWGGPVSQWSAGSRQAMDQAIKAAAAIGVTVLSASGDNDANDGTGSPITDYPAASPYGTGCGGTSLMAQGGGGLSEVVWNDGQGGGTGGGYCQNYQKPTWQVDPSGQPLSGPGRMVPDLAAVADPATGWQIYLGGWQVVGGTSCVSPFYAGVLAAFNSKLQQVGGASVGFINQMIYRHPEAFNDIVVGDNVGYRATKGADPCTGMGTPNGDRLWSVLSGNVPPPPVKTTPPPSETTTKPPLPGNLTEQQVQSAVDAIFDQMIGRFTQVPVVGSFVADILRRVKSMVDAEIQRLIK